MTGPWTAPPTAEGRATAVVAKRVRAVGKPPWALELALALPVALLIYGLSFETSRAVATYRRLSDMTAQIADVAGQASGGYARHDIDAINAGSSEIMAPFPAEGLTISTTEIVTNAKAGAATVVWSRGLADGVASSPHKRGESLTALPANLAPRTSYILVQAAYAVPTVSGVRWWPALPPLKTELIATPRRAAPIACSDCD